MVDEKTQDERIEELSQKIFGKPSKDIKYLLVTGYVHQQLLDEELARTGLYQWINVFNGEIKYPREVVNYNDYDIVQVNMSAQDIPLLINIKESLPKDSKTKLVLNNDYTSEAWGMAFPSPDTIRRETSCADMIFGTEYYQVSALSEMLRRQVYVIPHPADVKRLKTLPAIPKKDIITTIWRRYDNFWYVPSLVTRNHGMTTYLIGYDKTQNPKTWLTTTMFDFVFEGTNYFDFCDQMRTSKILYDPFTFHSYNRAIVDCAALGVAVVGSNRTQSIMTLYPFTAVDPYDVLNGRKLIDRLLEDKEFYDKVVKYALEHVEVYNHKNSLEKYLMALDESLASKEEQEIVKTKKSVEKMSGNDTLIAMAKEKNRDEKENKSI
jgi:hypothetical protein